MILRDKTQNLRRVWGAYVLENHAQKLGSLSKIGHIGHLGLGRVDFEKDVIKLPIFTRGFPMITWFSFFDISRGDSYSSDVQTLVRFSEPS